jgi:hypothetical protein
MDRLRDEIVKWLYNETTLSEVECEAAGDGLLSLLDAERCEWKDDGYGDYAAQCGRYFSFGHDIVDDKYCPHCGRRIEVKDGQG